MGVSCRVSKEVVAIVPNEKLNGSGNAEEGNAEGKDGGLADKIDKGKGMAKARSVVQPTRSSSRIAAGQLGARIDNGSVVILSDFSDAGSKYSCTSSSFSFSMSVRDAPPVGPGSTSYYIP
ncbi:hypothetical protein AMTRI_Chr02g261200 [Amborella trichopoda]